MGQRSVLQQELETLLGTRNVYFQPPPSLKLNYPAIVYSRNNIDSKYADNLVYGYEVEYEIIVIDRDPDSIVVDKMANFRNARFNRHYTSDNLYHDVFTLYY